MKNLESNRFGSAILISIDRGQMAIGFLSALASGYMLPMLGNKRRIYNGLCLGQEDKRQEKDLTMACVKGRKTSVVPFPRPTGKHLMVDPPFSSGVWSPPNIGWQRVGAGLP